MYYHNYFDDIEEEGLVVYSGLDNNSWLNNIILYLTEIMLFQVNDEEIRVARADLIDAIWPEDPLFIKDVIPVENDCDVDILGTAYQIA